MSRKCGLLVLLVATMSAVFVAPASAATIWDGDASHGTGVFGNMNCDSPGTVTAVDDATQGRVWRYHKPSGSNRCETNGVDVDGKEYKFKNGSTYYFGWRSKLSSTTNNNANFQWKSFGNHTQNYPVVLKVIDGKMTMIQRQPGKKVHTIWSAPITANSWNSYVIGLSLSDKLTGGWVELWFNGVKQKFKDGSQRWACRTHDDINKPKWGTYGAEDKTVTNYVDALKIGSSYQDVAPR